MLFTLTVWKLLIDRRLQGIPEEYFQYAYALEEETPEGICDILLQIVNEEEKIREKVGSAAKEFVLCNKNGYIQAKRILSFLRENV